VTAYAVVRVVQAVVHFLEVWWWAFALVPAAAAAVLAVRLVIRTRKTSPPGPPITRLPWLRHLPRALLVAARWHHLARNLTLAYADKHVKGKVRHPRAVVHPSAHGVVARVRTVPGTGRAQLEQAAEHIANSWRCTRVSVTQPRLGGRVVVRGVRHDPLLLPLPASVLPVFDGRHVLLGRDEWGAMRSADLANLSGSAFSGSPGRGKTEAALSLAVQLAPSPLVDMWIFDGGACDWEPFAEGAAGYVADDLDRAEDMLANLNTLMCERRRTLAQTRGSRNGWHRGPDESYRLQWWLMEEAPFYFDEQIHKGSKARQDQVGRIKGLAGALLRRGRAPLFHGTLIAQKGTGTGGLPPDLRDLCGLRWSFGVATTDAAVAVLGDDIRKYETMSPTLLQGPEHVGIASVLLRTGTSPYTLVKFPEVGQARADQAAEALAARGRVVVPDDASALVPVR